MNMPFHYITTFELLQFQWWHNRLWHYSDRLSQIFRYFRSFCWWWGVCDWVTRHNTGGVSVRSWFNDCGKLSGEELRDLWSPSVCESLTVLGDIFLFFVLQLMFLCQRSPGTLFAFRCQLFTHYFYTLLLYVLLRRQIFGVPSPFLLSSLQLCTVFVNSPSVVVECSAHLIWPAFMFFSLSEFSKSETRCVRANMSSVM